MRIDLVVVMARKLIQEATGLKVKVEKEFEHSYALHLYVKNYNLGSTSVTRTHLGTYIIGGKSTGCFIYGGQNDGISEILKEDFRKLEERVNKEVQSEKSNS